MEGPSGSPIGYDMATGSQRKDGPRAYDSVISQFV